MSLSKEYYVKKILESSEFIKSAKYQKLLKYLIEASAKGNVPKEVTIAYEVFDIDVGRESVNEANIRVYIHNLRKKLDSYYIGEGKEDKIILRIPKGRYKVEFIKKEHKAKSKRNFFIILILFILLLHSI